MSSPKGELAIQTLAMPADTNPHGDIFGGWLVAQMDLAAGILAKSLSLGRVATVAIDSMSFLRPVKVGDLVSCYVHLIKRGRTSLTIGVEVWTKGFSTGERFQVTEGTFVSVAVDEHNRPRELPAEK